MTISKDTFGAGQFMEDLTKVEEVDREKTLELFGAKYYQPGASAYHEASDNNLYHYEVHVGPELIVVEKGDSLFYLSEDKLTAWRIRGQGKGSNALTVNSAHFAVKVRGYMADTVARRLDHSHTILPYVNGCSTKQIFAPERIGDPTLQMLDIPPYSAEQAHHIHSTVRVVYVLRGRGISEVGMEGKNVRTELLPGMVVVLEPMSPHHFETPQGEHIVVLPVHIWSSVGAAEYAHPMFLGTHMMNQGG